MRTLKQIVNRVKVIAQSHQQINQVGFGQEEDLKNLEKSGLTYPMCFIEILQDVATSRDDKMQRFNFNLFFFDLQNVLEDARGNILEVQSDLTSIATDVLAMLQRDVDVDPNQDWMVSPATTLSIDHYTRADICIGVKLPIQIALRYAADRCQVPSTEISEILNDMKIISVYKYRTETDAETITLPLIKKEIMMAFKGNVPMKQVDSNPQPDEFVYNHLTGDFTFSPTVYAGTLLQFIHRPI